MSRIADPSLHIAILLLANPIVFLTFTRALLLILIGLSASVLVSLLWLHVFFPIFANSFLDFFSLVYDAIYTCFFNIGRLTQFTQASMDVFCSNCLSGAFGHFSIDRLTQFIPVLMEVFLRLIGGLTHWILTQFTQASTKRRTLVISFTVVDTFEGFFNNSRCFHWILALGRALQGDGAAFGCLILLMTGSHCHSYFACRIWSVALLAAMVGDSSSAVHVATFCFALWKPLLPPKKDKAKLHGELALLVQAFLQEFGRVPGCSSDAERRSENKLRHKIDQHRKNGGITEEQYRPLISVAEDDDTFMMTRS